MSGAAHLERMGRELKCPICLSLLNSAASLSCNHVFCNSCIHASMKSAAYCPVCKVPFRPREVRPAPQMDNLVSIYKSLEAASGVNIFDTQTESSTKTIGDESKSHRKKTIGIVEKGSTSHKAKNGSQTSSFPRASFPTKKRVQVQQHQPLESPPPSKKAVESGQVTVSEHQKILFTNTGNMDLNEKGDVNLCPFFWLREDIEETTQQSLQSDGDHSTSTPCDIPCFSDMKDSDDETPLEVTPKSTSPGDIETNADFFDSEMFEWTQRPCSPELFSSPLNLQDEGIYESEGVEQNIQPVLMDSNVLLEARSRNAENIIDGNGTNNGDMNLPTKSSLRNEKADVKGALKKSRETLLMCERNKKSGCKRASHEPAGDPSGQHKLAKPSERRDIERSAKKRKVTVTEKHSSCHTSKRGKKVPKDRTLPIGDVASNPYSLNTFASTGDGNDLTNSSSKVRRKSKCAGKSKMKQVTFSEEDGIADVVQKFHENSIKETQIPDTRSSSLCMDTNDFPKRKKSLFNLSSPMMKKCQTSPAKVQCGFCHTAEESEDSGLLVHYHNGKPIKENEFGATNIIHVHKNCAEWAPNVYFNDDDVINLESELKRSKNISCSFCGVKGAALGCYEKTCRRSFHVPCAKMTPKCRWDYDNFVMLCPLHACCKLPCEVPEFQSKKKRKYKVRISGINQPRGSVEFDSQGVLWKPTKKDKRFVLCCSAITDAEKAIVSDFKRLSGATVVKTWDTSVTHIIASIDEKGACRRTLKYLMGVLGGKWILTIEWIKACLNAAEHVDEQPYEIEVDTHGVRDGPRLGRLRMTNKEPKLFNGYKFYFMGDFLPSHKKYLPDLVVAAGGTVLNRKPVNETSLLSASSSTFIVYSLEIPDKCDSREKSSILDNRRLAAEALANSTGSLAATDAWVMDSIAGLKLQHLT
ncbi:unnamed protein product [Cuscuta epithymum]|uniref:Uncharacterized protein n=1 Tax=Cuscuta epithymum TaxID=186058 RepID=A0AAV0DX65_9ASTE|nr:unnamed protein product [Cuscuta epithymum]